MTWDFVTDVLFLRDAVLLSDFQCIKHSCSAVPALAPPLPCSVKVHLLFMAVGRTDGRGTDRGRDGRGRGRRKQPFSFLFADEQNRRRRRRSAPLRSSLTNLRLERCEGGKKGESKAAELKQIARMDPHWPASSCFCPRSTHSTYRHDEMKDCVNVEGGCECVAF